MAAIYLVRHGQASFGKADYDQLSEKGSKQAEMLGKFWQKMTVPDQCYAGDLLRHHQTADHFFNGLHHENKAKNQTKLPIVTHSGFNEFDHIDVLIKYKPHWQDHQFMLKEISAYDDPNKAFENEFSLAMQRWFSGKYDDYNESCQQFKQRCIQALQDVIKQTKQEKNIIVFTSGGTISVILQYVLALADAQTMGISQQLVNSSVTKLIFSQDRITLNYLNNYSHIDDDSKRWLTYR